MYKKQYHFKFIVISLIFLLFSSLSVYADDTSIVPKDKIWIVTYSEKIDLDKLAPKAVQVKDSKNKDVKINLSLSEDEKTLIISPPLNGYTPEENYTLFIKSDLEKSKSNFIINPFRIEKELSNEPNSRRNPAPIGNSYIITDTDYLCGDIEYILTFDDIIIGSEAWDIIEKSSMFNDPPEKNKQYILSKFTLELTSTENDEYMCFSSVLFDTVSSSGSVYEPNSPVLDGEFRGYLYSGGKMSGWVVSYVDKSDSPVLVTKKCYGAEIWFDLSQNIKTENTSKNSSKKDSNSSNISKSNTYDFTTITGLTNYLKDNYSELETSIGKTYFDFKILENDVNSSPYDYWVQVNFDLEFFTDLKYSTKLTSTQKNTVKKELKAFQEKIGKDIISKIPGKKIMGEYYISWYKYPNLQVDLITLYYYTWTNFNTPTFNSDKSFYDQTKPSSFRWLDLLDDEF